MKNKIKIAGLLLIGSTFLGASAIAANTPQASITCNPQKYVRIRSFSAPHPGMMSINIKGTIYKTGKNVNIKVCQNGKLLPMTVTLGDQSININDAMKRYIVHKVRYGTNKKSISIDLMRPDQMSKPGNQRIGLGNPITGQDGKTYQVGLGTGYSN